LFSENETQNSQTPNYPTYNSPQKQKSGLYTYAGLFCAVIALFVLPEIFGAAAAILGAYVYRLDCGTTRNRGLWIVILGIVFMLVGIYYTAFFALYQILP
jgi:lipopolysaccharide export LptBFGC system permease protein LptF